MKIPIPCLRQDELGARSPLWVKSSICEMALHDRIQLAPGGCVRRHRAFPCSVSGFTLIELLVVIAIIVLLAAMLLPVLANAKLHASTGTCLSNQKQLVLSWLQYNDDNRDRLINMDPQGYNSGKVSWRYDDWNPALLTVPPNSTPQQTHIMQFEACYKEAGFWMYAPNPNVVHCPGDLRAQSPVGPNIYTYATAAPGYFAWGSYSGAGGLNGQDGKPLLKARELQHTSARFVFVEECDPRGENEGSWDQNSQTTVEDSAASWHGNLSTFSFADGHVQKHGWADPIFIAYAKNMNPGKYQGAGGTLPTVANSPHDLPWLFAGYPNKSNP